MDNFPLIFFSLFAFAGCIFLLQGLRLFMRSRRLAAKGLRAEAEVIRIDVRESHGRRDDMPVIENYYTEVVRYVTWEGQMVEARLPEKNEEEKRAKPGDVISIVANPDDPAEIAPASGGTTGLTAVILIVAGAAMTAGAARMIGGFF